MMDEKNIEQRELAKSLVTILTCSEEERKQWLDKMKELRDMDMAVKGGWSDRIYAIDLLLAIYEQYTTLHDKSIVDNETVDRFSPCVIEHKGITWAEMDSDDEGLWVHFHDYENKGKR